MADFLIRSTLSNLVVSTILAVIAWAVQRRFRSPSLVNLLWALVLVKMVTPPLFAIPLLEVPNLFSLSVPKAAAPSERTPHLDLGGPRSHGHWTDSEISELRTNTVPEQSFSSVFGARSAAMAFGAWLIVSAILLVVSVSRIARFHWSLKTNTRVHHVLSRQLSADIARKFGLRKHPRILVTCASLPPFVWWMAGRSVIVVSARAIQELDDADLRLVITHEMAHIKRHDHWFRWLEWIALIGLWWNPVMWWARHHLRVSEEMACDDLVLETAAPDVNQYANSLLNMAELLTSPVIRPPVVASALNNGGSLEERLKMMIAEKNWKVPAAMRLAIVAMATCIAPLGIVCAQDYQALERRLGGAVEAGEISLEQAGLMMDALRSSQSREMAAKKRRYTELAKDIEAAVEAGELSKEDAEKKLIAVRREMFEVAEQAEAKKRGMEVKKRRYMELAKDIEAAVEAGKLSKQDAEKKLIAMRREMFEVGEQVEAEKREMEVKKRRYMELAKDIEAAVEAGKLSKQDAEKKLVAVRRKMFEVGEQVEAEKREMEAKKRRYMEFTIEIKAAVEAGKLSKEDAEKKLVAMRREMFEEAP